MAATTRPQTGDGSGGNGGKVNDGDRKRSFKVRGWVIESHASPFSLDYSYRIKSLLKPFFLATRVFLSSHT